MIDMGEYRRPVRRSLLHRDLMAGIPQAGLLFLFILATVFMYGLRLYFMGVPIAVLYVVMRALTRIDPWLIDILLENVRQKDRLLP